MGCPRLNVCSPLAVGYAGNSLSCAATRGRGFPAAPRARAELMRSRSLSGQPLAAATLGYFLLVLLAMVTFVLATLGAAWPEDLCP